MSAFQSGAEYLRAREVALAIRDVAPELASRLITALGDCDYETMVALTDRAEAISRAR
jgi:hypothetical protein